MTELEARPNIRIEIRNTSENPLAMEIDDEDNNKSEEEGEIRDIRDKQHHQTTISDTIIVDTDHKKLEERAKRFALKPDEIKTFTELDLNNVYISLGINSENADQIRFQAIHVRTSKIKMEQIVNYFKNFGPNYIELVDDESCNVVWKDKFSSARALYHSSQPVRGMPVRTAPELNIDFMEEEEPGNLLNKDRIVELQEDTNEIFENSVDISSINIPIPPGYWRIGTENINSHSVLLRFSMKIDKKPVASENCAKWFKSLNTFNSGGATSNRNHGIFSRNKEISDKNPWGILAETWDDDSNFREKERINLKKNIELHTDSLPISSEPELRSKLTAKRRLAAAKVVEKVSAEDDKAEADDESDEENSVKKTTKIPRMRMYADEEEEKIKKRRLLQTLKKQNDILKKSEIPNSDLRNILRVNKRSQLVAPVKEEKLGDLSMSLKNRSRNLVFTVSQERRDVRSRLKDREIPEHPIRAPISPVRFREKSPGGFRSDRSRRRLDVRQHRQSRRSSNERFKGRMYSEDPEYTSSKPRSKVALVIKTQKKPSVASAIQSRKFRTSQSSSSEESGSSSSSGDSSSSSSDSDDESTSKD